MAVLFRLIRKYYGAHPAHLLAMLSGFALVGYTLVTFTPSELWNQGTWWQSIGCGSSPRSSHTTSCSSRSTRSPTGSSPLRRRANRRPEVAARNYIRVPALAAGLTLLIFLPGIIEQGATAYQAATGQTQQPFLGRWLLLTAVMFGISAVGYATRRAVACRRAADGPRSEQSNPQLSL